MRLKAVASVASLRVAVTKNVRNARRDVASYTHGLEFFRLAHVCALVTTSKKLHFNKSHIPCRYASSLSAAMTELMSRVVIRIAYPVLSGFLRYVEVRFGWKARWTAV